VVTITGVDDKELTGLLRKVRERGVRKGFVDYTDPEDPGFEVILNWGLAGWVPVRGRHALPRHFSARLDSPPLPPLDLDFVAETDGYVVCTRLEITARDEGSERGEVTLAGIRNIRIAELKRRATQLAIAEVVITDDFYEICHPVFGSVIDVGDTLREIEQKAHRPHRGKKLSDVHLREVAKVYRAALKDAKPKPTKAVQQHFYTARANAGRWVAEARRRGFLGEAESPRQPGEKTMKGGKSRGER
jgi:hypothetical protein